MVVPLTSNNLRNANTIYCSKHTYLKLKYHWSPCKKSVCTECIRIYHNDHAQKSLTTDVQKLNRLQYGDEIKESLGNHALDAIRMLDRMFESAFPPPKKKEPCRNDISQNKTPNRSTTCILQKVYPLYGFWLIGKCHVIFTYLITAYCIKFPFDQKSLLLLSIIILCCYLNHWPFNKITTFLWHIVLWI